MHVHKDEQYMLLGLQKSNMLVQYYTKVYFCNIFHSECFILSCRRKPIKFCNSNEDSAAIV